MIYLIADDDALIRFTMKSMLLEFIDESSVLLEARNGKELLALCKSSNPDIVFADIEMPYLNGLQAIQEARELGLGGEFVIISGYMDFSYAQKAIGLGINEYLVKPVSPSELEHILSRLHAKLGKARRDLNSHFQLEVLNAYSTFVNTQTVHEPDTLDNMVYTAFYEHSWAGLDATCIESELESTNAGVLRSNGYYCSFYASEGNRVFLFKTLPSSVPDLVSSFYRMAGLRDAAGEDVLYVQCQADSLGGVFAMLDALDGSQPAFLAQKPNVVVPYGQFAQEACPDLGAFLSIRDALGTDNIISLREALRNVCEIPIQKTGIHMEYLVRNVSSLLGHSFAAVSYPQLCDELQRFSNFQLSHQGNDRNELIDVIKEYVDAHYASAIGISDIAQYFKITPNYLSTLFHQKMQTKFIDYITALRLDKAKVLLLKNKNTSVKDIALMVGYTSPRHFSELFQRLEHLTPSQYRQEHSRK